MKFTATLTVDVDPIKVNAEEIKAVLESSVQRMFDDFRLQIERQDAEIHSCDVKVEAEEPETPKGGCHICGHDH